MGDMAGEKKPIFGWSGKILRIDLTKKTIHEDELPEEYIEGYIGGAGINARILYDVLRENPTVDALDPANPLIFGCGPLVGTEFPCASRFTVTSKSPLTGIFGDSNAGGFFPVRLKQAGYDHIVIQGASDTPVALFIEKGATPQIIDATDVWGLDTYETDAKLHQKFGDCETARIGQAGENLVRYANILSGTKRISTNGRTGMGCVMGSKKLKAIIIKASGTVPSAEGTDASKFTKLYRDAWLNGPGTTLKRQYGTLTNFSQIAEHTRVKNEQEPLTTEQLDAYDLDLFTDSFKTGQTACYRCPVACTQTWEVKEGPYKGDKGDKVEYGHLLSLGPNIGIFDFPSMLHLAHISNRLGLDCIQFGYNMAISMECFQRGLLTAEAIQHPTLHWGDEKTVEKFMLQTALREGFGDLLAENAPTLATGIGPEAEQYGVHIKGMSFPFSCSFALPMSLASSVATRGADHLKGHPFASIIGHTDMLEKMFGVDIPPESGDHFSPVAKGRVVWWQENYKMVLDSLGVCFLAVINSNVWCDPLIMMREMGEMYEAITGRDPSNLFMASERAYQIERCINALQGITGKDDVRKGTLRGEKNPVELPGMLDEYYEYRGCSTDGLPTRKRLEEIGLKDVADDLERYGKLSDESRPAIEELLKDSTDIVERLHAE